MYIPMSDTFHLLRRHFTPALVETPKLGVRLVWLELYKAGCYPNGAQGCENYYTAATITPIKNFNAL